MLTGRPRQLERDNRRLKRRSRETAGDETGQPHTGQTRDDDGDDAPDDVGALLAELEDGSRTARGAAGPGMGPDAPVPVSAGRAKRGPPEAPAPVHSHLSMMSYPPFLSIINHPQISQLYTIALKP